MPILLATMLAVPNYARGHGYDPLAADVSDIGYNDLTIHDRTRDRDIPVRIYLPATANAAPVILFSHGMGGSRSGSAFFGKHWAARGYVAVFLQHQGSDEALWKGKPARQRLEAMRDAISVDNLLLRAADVSSVLNQLEVWNSEKTNTLAGRMNLKKIGMSGHSFGAATTEAVSGETLPVIGQALTDARISAAMAFSPSSPTHGTADEAFGSVSIPWMLMTGTKDIAPIGHADMKSRLAVYPALHGAPKYELVLHNAEHSVFIEGALPGETGPRNPNHRRVILALSTAFLDAYLRGDAQALSWLQGAGPRSVMEADDHWQFSAH